MGVAHDLSRAVDALTWRDLLLPDDTLSLYPPVTLIPSLLPLLHAVQLLLTLVQDHIDSVAESAVELARHRHSDTVDIQDVQLCLGEAHEAKPVAELKHRSAPARSWPSSSPGHEPLLSGVGIRCQLHRGVGIHAA